MKQASSKVEINFPTLLQEEHSEIKSMNNLLQKYLTLCMCVGLAHFTLEVIDKRGKPKVGY